MNVVPPCLHICISKDQAEFDNRLKIVSFFVDSFSLSILYFWNWYPWQFARMTWELGFKASMSSSSNIFCNVTL